MIDPATARNPQTLIARTVTQIVRFLRFDGAALYWDAPKYRLLWPLFQSETIADRVAPVTPDAPAVRAIFRSEMPTIVEGEAVGAVSDRWGTWLHAEHAKTIVFLPLRIGSDHVGLIALLARRPVAVDLGMLRAIRILSARLAVELRRLPLFTANDIQRQQLGLLRELLTLAASESISDEVHVFERVAKGAMLLSGAHAVGFAVPGGLHVFSCRAGRLRSGFARRSGLPRERRHRSDRTIMECNASAEVALLLAFQCSFTPSEEQHDLLDSLAHSLGALNGLRERLAAQRREQLNQYLAHVGGMLTASLDPPTVLASIKSLCVPSIADWIAVERASGEISAMESGEQQRLAEVITVPLAAGREVIGGIAFGRSADRGPANQQDRDVYEKVGRLAASAIANANLFDEQRSAADILQRALLPNQLPTDRRVFFGSLYAPAPGATLVGGDWYDAFALDDDRFVLSIGDVAGHGIQSSATMNLVRLALRVAALAGHDLSEGLEFAERAVRSETPDPDLMVTACYGVLNLRTSAFSFISAGHPPPLLLKENGAIVDTVQTPARPPLGFGSRPPEEMRQTEIALAPGDTLILYTDGLVEYGRDYAAGERHLKEVLRNLAATEPRSRLARDIQEHTFDRSTTQVDDVAILTISLPGEQRTLQWSLPAIPSSAPRLRERLEALLVEVPRKGLDSFEILTAAGEAVANAIEHAYSGDAGMVTMRACYDATGVSVEVSDQGRYKENGTRPGRGYGQMLMQALAKDVALSRSDSGTVVRLSFG